MFERVIIASGTSNRQTKALAASVRNSVKGQGMPVLSTEGEDNGEWIIVDCGAAVAHIMQPAIREYYHLEEIWGGKAVRLKLGEVNTKLVKASEPEPARKRAAAKKPAARQAAPAGKPAPRSAAKPAPRSTAKPAGKAAGKTAAKSPTRKAADKSAAYQRVGARRPTAPAAKTAVAGKPPARKATAAKTPARKATAKAPVRKAPRSR